MTEYVVDLTDKQTTDLRKVRRERIVRCRDCKYSFVGCLSGATRCKRMLIQDTYEPGCMKVDPDGFCAWGEEREG